MVEETSIGRFSESFVAPPGLRIGWVVNPVSFAPPALVRE